MSEIRECPFCGGRWRWHYRHSVGARMIEGRAECDGCGARMGDGLIALDNDDLRPRIAELVNARWERTCQMSNEDWRDSFGEYKHLYECGVCSESTALLCCVNEDGDTEWVKPKFCGNCGAKAVGE